MTELTAPEVQISQEESSLRQEVQGVAFGKGIVIVLICTVLFAVIGIGVGKAFFWNNFNQATKLENDLKLNQEKVKSEPNNALAHINLGWSYYLMGENERAIGEFKKVLSLDPKNYLANYQMGLTFVAMEQFDRAIASFKEAISIAPNTFGAHLNLGVSFIKTNRLDEALKELDLAAKFNPGASETMYWRGVALEKQNKLEDALAEYNGALDLSPKFKEAEEAVKRLKEVLKK